MRTFCLNFFVVSLLAAAPLSAVETPGIAAAAPAGVRSVKVEQGFMVPYTVKIPGSDVTFEMVPVPGGKVLLGSPADEAGRDAKEGPQCEITVEPFWMAKTECTWAEYKVYMATYSAFKGFELRNLRPVTPENQADAVTAPTELYDPSFTFELGEDPQQPAVTMTQYAAKQYTKWLTGLSGQFHRLPSEAEWEYACRAGTTTAYHFGNDASQLGEYAWFYDNAEEKPQLVGKKKPNPWGLHDMHGNAAEWVLDELLDDGYQWLAGKPHQATDAIAWPKKEFPRVLKGGNWDDEAPRCRTAARMASHDRDWKSEDPNLPLSPWWFTTDPARGVGFRVIRPLQAPPAKDRAKFWDPDVDAIRFAVEGRLQEGRGVLGLVGPDLPAAIESLKAEK